MPPADTVATVSEMPLTIDLAAAVRRVTDDELRSWASTQVIFLSSVMGELGAERRELAQALEDAGFTVRWFEGLGGRDDDAERAYLSEVAACSVYIGLLGNEYGTMLPSGFSPTHEEFIEARRRGKRISFWIRADGDGRAGHARNFLSEIRAFYVTGTFEGASDLPGRLLVRLREIAADDLAPWIKVADLVVRAETIRDSGQEVKIECEVRDREVQRALENLDPARTWGGRDDLKITYANRSGTGRLTDMEIETTSMAARRVTLRASVRWAEGGDSMVVSTGGFSAEDLVEVGLRAGLLGEALPERLGGIFMVDGEDPLAALAELPIPEGSLQPIARLLICEQLVGANKASSIDEVLIGPLTSGRRRIRVVWREARRYANSEPGVREVEGERAW